jgi:hypothetical protein
MRIWLDDAMFHLANALRSVGVGLATAAWTSVLSAHLQLPTDVRTYAGIGLSLFAAAATHVFFGARPPSMTVVELLQPLERDILAVARERAGGDGEAVRFLAARVAAQAAVGVRQGARLPRDRRAWLRSLAAQAPLGDRRNGAATD